MNVYIFWIPISICAAFALYGLIRLIRWYAQGKKYEKENRIDGKIVIVTGANTGIGKETALELAKRGAVVYMACRDMAKCEKARHDIVMESHNKNIYGRQLDLSSMASIREFVDRFKSEQNRLDILVNNAGVMACPKSTTADGFEMQLGVNHLGHFLLTNLLLDLLKKSAPSRIVVVSSGAHYYGRIKLNDLNSEKSYNSNMVYAQSKLANVLFARELAKRLQGSGVTVNALHPGVVETEIARHFKFLNNVLADIFLRPLMRIFMKTPKNGAQTTLYAALDPELENVSGCYFSNCRIKEPSKAAKDGDLSKWLWEQSEQCMKLKSN